MASMAISILYAYALIYSAYISGQGSQQRWSALLAANCSDACRCWDSMFIYAGVYVTIIKDYT